MVVGEAWEEMQRKQIWMEFQGHVVIWNWNFEKPALPAIKDASTLHTFAPRTLDYAQQTEQL